MPGEPRRAFVSLDNGARVRGRTHLLAGARRCSAGVTDCDMGKTTLAVEAVR